jgi:hypothetical protein
MAQSLAACAHYLHAYLYLWSLFPPSALVSASAVVFAATWLHVYDRDIVHTTCITILCTYNTNTRHRRRTLATVLGSRGLVLVLLRLVPRTRTRVRPAKANARATRLPVRAHLSIYLVCHFATPPTQTHHHRHLCSKLKALYFQLKAFLQLTIIFNCKASSCTRQQERPYMCEK